jgi:hypothetical protein
MLNDKDKKGPQARELYLIMRAHIIEQTKIFYSKHAPDGEGLKFVKFKVWLDKYPFVRTIFRESMVPRIWTLNNIKVVPDIEIDASLQSVSD